MIMKRAFTAIKILVKADKEVRAAWGRANGCESVVEAMRSVLDKVDVMNEGILALVWLTSENGRNRDKITESGGIELIIQVLNDRYKTLTPANIDNACHTPTTSDVKSDPRCSDIIPRYVHA